MLATLSGEGKDGGGFMYVGYSTVCNWNGQEGMYVGYTSPNGKGKGRWDAF